MESVVIIFKSKLIRAFSIVHVKPLTLCANKKHQTLFHWTCGIQIAQI